MPQELDCGHCLAGDSKTVVVKCDNFGGEGSFKLHPLDGTPGSQEDQKQVYKYTMYVYSLTVTHQLREGQVVVVAIKPDLKGTCNIHIIQGKTFP